jgi:hypothetical protein
VRPWRREWKARVRGLRGDLGMSDEEEGIGDENLRHDDALAVGGVPLFVILGDTVSAGKMIGTQSRMSSASLSRCSYHKSLGKTEMMR